LRKTSRPRSALFDERVRQEKQISSAVMAAGTVRQTPPPVLSAGAAERRARELFSTTNAESELPRDAQIAPPASELSAVALNRLQLSRARRTGETVCGTRRTAGVSPLVAMLPNVQPERVNERGAVLCSEAEREVADDGDGAGTEKAISEPETKEMLRHTREERESEESSVENTKEE
jgi:hypothetical protein